jgi:hypothetical protein
MVDTLYQDISINEDLRQVQSIIRAQLNSSTPFIQEALTELVGNNGKCCDLPCLYSPRALVLQKKVQPTA